jgi:O-antigen/teichoic acid export membrane protein
VKTVILGFIGWLFLALPQCRQGTTAWNATLNFGAQGVQMVATVICIPFLVNALGAERFGILTLIWAVVGYFSILDLGVGRAVTHSVSRLLAANTHDKIPRVFWSAVAIQASLGVLGAIMLTSSIPLFSGKLLNIPVQLKSEAGQCIILCAISLPVVLVSLSFVGLLQAARRFDVSNGVTAPSSVAAVVVPAIVASYAPDLPAIMLSIVIVRVISCAALLTAACRIYPNLINRFHIDLKEITPLIRYGRWVTLSAILSPLLIYADRFVIGSLLTMGLVACYTIPYEAGVRLTIIADSIVLALFPVIAAAGEKNDQEDIARLLGKAMTILLVGVSFLAAVVYLFSEPIMTLWLGKTIGEQSGPVLTIIIVGAFINSIAFVPYTTIQALGRPDITAKLHLVEIPIHIFVLWYAVTHWGIRGAAFAYVFRVSLDFCLLCIALSGLTHTTIRRVIFSQYVIGALFFALEILALWTVKNILGWGVAGVVIGLILAALFSGFAAKRICRL